MHELTIFAASPVAWLASRRWRAATSRSIVLAPLLVSGAFLAPASAQTQQWQVSEERRIGPPSVEFAAITGAALDESGRLWIADGMAGELHVEEDGRIRRVARAGEGPGELAPGAIEVVPLRGDTILVIEPHTLRLHRFTSDGGFVRTNRITGETGMTGQWQRVPGGGLAARIYPGTVVEPDTSPGEEGDAVRAFDLDGRAGAVLATLPPTESFRMGEGPLPIVTVLAPQPLWSIDAGGRILVGSTHAYEVRAVEPDGLAATVVSEPVAPGPIGREVEDRARELLRETMVERRTPPPVVEAMVEAAAVAERAPVLGRILAGPGGTLWLQRAASTGADLRDLERPGGPSWEVHDASGARIGAATLPAGVRVLGWSGDRLVGIAHSELGEASAVVLRVERGG
jgi:hypothetical protein